MTSDFRQYIAGYTVANLWLYPIRRRVAFASALEFLFIVTPIVGVCNYSMSCCMLLYVHSSIAIILMGKRELVALLNLSSWCLVMVERLFLAVPWGCLPVCDCGISWSYSLTIFVSFYIKFTRLGFENACWIARQASRCQQAFSKPCLVNLISKDTHLVFSLKLTGKRYFGTCTNLISTNASFTRPCWRLLERIISKFASHKELCH